MILRQKIWIGVGAGVASMLALGLGLGLGLPRNNTTTQTAASINPFIATVNATHDSLDTRLDSGASTTGEYTRLFGTKNLSYDFKNKRLVINFAPLFASNQNAVSLGRAYGVVVDEVNYSSNSAPLLDRENLVQVPVAEITTFATSQPEARKVSTSSEESTTGLATFAFAALDGDGDPIFTAAETSRQTKLINPQTGAVEIIDGRGVDTVRDAKILTAVKFVLAKISKIADATGVSVAYTNLVGTGYTNQITNLSLVADTTNANAQLLVSNVGDSLAAFQALFSAQNVNKNFNHVTAPYVEFITLSQYQNLTADEQAKYVVFDDKDEAKFTSVTEVVTITRTATQASSYAVYYEKSRSTELVNPLQVNATDVSNYLTTFDQKFVDDVTNLKAEHSADQGLFDALDTSHLTQNRVYKTWDVYADGAKAYTENTSTSSLKDLYALHRTNVGFTFYANYGLKPNNILAKATPGAKRDLARLMLNAYSKKAQWGATGSAPIATILNDVSVTNLFASVDANFALDTTQAWGAYGNEKPVVLSNDQSNPAMVDNGLYVNMVRNFLNVNSKPAQRVFAKSEFKTALFANANVTDVQLLTWLFLQAALIDYGANGAVASDLKISLPVTQADAETVLGANADGVSYDNGYIILSKNVIVNLAKVLSLTTVNVRSLDNSSKAGDIKTLTGADTLIDFSATDVNLAREAVERRADNSYGTEYANFLAILNLN